MMTTIAMPITTMPSVEPGCETDSGVGVGVDVWVRRDGRGVGTRVARADATPRAEVLARPAPEGDNASVKASAVARSSIGSRKRKSALFMLRQYNMGFANNSHRLCVFFLAFTV